MSNLKHLLKDVKICRKSIFSFFLSKSCFLVLSNYWTFFCCLLAISNLLTFGLFLSGFIQPKLNLIDLKIFLSFISRRFNFVQLILLNCTEISRITNEYYSIIMEKTESFTCLDDTKISMNHQIYYQLHLRSNCWLSTYSITKLIMERIPKMSIIQIFSDSYY